MERGYQEITGMFPRPGKALKAVLVLVAGLSLVNYILYNWVPGGRIVFNALVCSTDEVLNHYGFWRLLTAGALTLPTGTGALSYLLFTLVGLYFLSPDLEKRWGPWRFLRFLAICTVAGFSLAIAIDRIAPEHLKIFHPGIMFGATAALTGTTVAWSRQNADRQIMLFFVLPIRGSWLFWLAVAYCVFGVVAWDDKIDSGVVAPFGGLVTGLLLGGTPSVLRTLWLKLRLAVLRKQSGVPSDRPSSPRPTRARSGPGLRVVYGGVEDELKKRKPPKDKRYLN
jgi:membrane associated rhomboid family serine protease